MGTYFGGRRSAREYQKKVKILVAGLTSIILLLVGVLAMMAQNAARNGVQVNDPWADSATATADTTIGILVSNQRVEKNTQITDDLFAVRQVLSQDMPLGAVKEDEKHFLIGQFAKEMIPAFSPFRQSALAKNPSIADLDIPNGYRASTIIVDKRQIVGGWAKPNSRVDVLFTYENRKKEKRIRSIIRFAKILSVAGTNRKINNNSLSEETTVTLLVSERDARKIELARQIGTLSLSLVGKFSEPGDGDPDDDFGICNLTGDCEEGSQVAENPDGTFKIYNSKRGEWVHYELFGNQWRPKQDS